MEPLSWDHRKKITDAVDRATTNGRDLPEYLNEYGLLATPQWQSRIRADAIRDVINALEHLPAAAVIGSSYHTGNWTANDIIAGFLKKLAEVEDLARKGEWLT